jgi:ferredoxin/flavodoxin---NADP+ reductase
MAETSPTGASEPAAEEPRGEALFNARLVERQELNPSLIICKIQLDEGYHADFEPGQFTNLGLPPRDPAAGSGSSGLVKRPYSIASAPGEHPTEFYIRLVDDGAFTPLLFEMPLGGRLWMDEKTLGRFTLSSVEDTDRDLVMVSTGTGIAPFVSMLRHFHGTNRWRRMVMINGVREAIDLGYREELERLDRQDAFFRYLPICSREPQAEGTQARWNGLRGYVMHLLDPEVYEASVGAPLTPERCQVFLCGNPAMIDAVEQHLQPLGFRPHSRRNPGHIHKERYW